MSTQYEVAREEAADRVEGSTATFNQDNVQGLRASGSGTTPSSQGTKVPNPQAGNPSARNEQREATLDGSNNTTTPRIHPVETATRRTTEVHAQDSNGTYFQFDFAPYPRSSSRQARHSIDALNADARRQSEATFQSPTPT